MFVFFQRCFVVIATISHKKPIKEPLRGQLLAASLACYYEGSGLHIACRLSSLWG